MDRTAMTGLSALRERAETMLSRTLLPFWTGLRDEEYGGFYGRVDYDLNVHKIADKGVILHSRILYFFSEYARVTGDMSYFSFARHAYEFILLYCFDRENGGVYWSVTYDGRPADTTKHTYNQAFAIYALSSYYALTRDPDAIAAAMELYSLIESQCSDGAGYLEAFDKGWTPKENEKLSENNVEAYRTMNTLLHVYEAYTVLYRETNNPLVGESLMKILDIYRSRVYNRQKRRQEVFFDRDYRSLIDLHSFGHDIESSWLIDYACGLLSDWELTDEVIAVNTSLAEQIYEEAYRDSSLCNESERGVVNTDRIWWVQCEAVIGFVNQWQKTGNGKYLTAAVSIWDYIEAKLVDKRPGSEWLWGLHEDGTPMEGQDVAGEWKCPYHNGRMCFEIIRRSL